MKSDVFYTNLRTGFNNSLLDKLNRLMTKAGISNIDFEDKYVAIKMHFGEPGNLAFLRPNWAKCVDDKVKELGGRPFLTDCNTLYVGGRKNALDHMLTAEQNGFNYVSTGCQIIIGDGLKGSDDIEIPVEGGKYIETAKIGRAIMDADIFISLSHFKGHEGTGFGGALKNIVAFCAGVATGLELGDNAFAALLTRGLSEMAKLTVKMGGNMNTIYGLTGLGDLIVTGMSNHSRNRRAGILVGQGKTIEDAKAEIGMVVESADNVKTTYELSKKYNVEMPIVRMAYKVIFEHFPPKDALYELMTRNPKFED